MATQPPRKPRASIVTAAFPTRPSTLPAGKNCSAS
jgi:hypothetical protein